MNVKQKQHADKFLRRTILSLDRLFVVAPKGSHLYMDLIHLRDEVKLLRSDIRDNKVDDAGNYPSTREKK